MPLRNMLASWVVLLITTRKTGKKRVNTVVGVKKITCETPQNCLVDKTQTHFLPQGRNSITGEGGRVNDRRKLTETEVLNETAERTRGLLQKHTKGLNNPINRRTLQGIRVPAAGIQVLKDRIGPLDMALTAAGDNVLGKTHHRPVLETTGGNQMIEWWTTTRDLPEDHTQRINIAFDRVSGAVLGQALGGDISHPGGVFPRREDLGIPSRPKFREDCRSVGVNQDGGRVEVAVAVALVVKVAQTKRNVHREVVPVGPRQVGMKVVEI